MMAGSHPLGRFYLSGSVRTRAIHTASTSNRICPTRCFISVSNCKSINGVGSASRLKPSFTIMRQIRILTAGRPGARFRIRTGKKKRGSALDSKEDKDGMEKKTVSAEPEKGAAALELMRKLVQDAQMELSESVRANGIRNSGGGSDSGGSFKKIEVPEDQPFVMILPISIRPLLPGVCCSLQIRDPLIVSAIMLLAKQNHPYIGAFLVQDPNFKGDLVSAKNEIHEIGVLAEIRSIIDADFRGSGVTIVVYPHERIRVKNVMSNVEQMIDDRLTSPESPRNYGGSADTDKGYALAVDLIRMGIPVAHIENVADEPFDISDPIVNSTLSEMLSLIRELCSINPLIKNQIMSYLGGEGSTPLMDATKIINIVATISSAPSRDLQATLECLNIRERLHFGLNLLKAELENAKLQLSISKQVEKKITKRQREYFLMEQLKEIQKELGMTPDGKKKLIEDFKLKAMSLKMPQDVENVLNEEISKLLHFDMSSSEFNVTRNYLDWLTNLPWGIRSEDKFDIFSAKRILDEDHYGLDEVKELILEFIAIGKLRSSLEGKVICLCGPPGVGKTSVGKSMARALNRAFYRFSVGGLTDVAEIRGHRRTYVGSMPGKPVQALRRVRTENPLIMIDEIDKIGTSGHGDPSSALLELLDPEQNNAFLDHYIDVPVDLSKVLFVCTANFHSNIPPALLDRMELIDMHGYIAEEKIDIAEKYLVSSALKQCGLTHNNLRITKDAIQELVKYYCRESGVRNLKKHIEKICRKVALQVATVMQRNENVTIDVKGPNLSVKNNAGLSYGHRELSNCANSNSTDSNLEVQSKEGGKSRTQSVHDMLAADENASSGKTDTAHNGPSRGEFSTQTSSEKNIRADKMPDPAFTHEHHENSPVDIKTLSEENIKSDGMPDPAHEHSDHQPPEIPLEEKTLSEKNIIADKMPDPVYNHDNYEKAPFNPMTPSEEIVRSEKMPDPINKQYSREENLTAHSEGGVSDKIPSPVCDQGSVSPPNKEYVHLWHPLITISPLTSLILY